MQQKLCIVVLASTLLLGGCDQILTRFVGSGEMPREMATARVVTGGESFKKTVFIKEQREGLFRDLQWVKVAGEKQPSLVALTRFYAVFLGRDEKEKRYILFADEETNHVILVDMEGDGVPEFLNRGRWCCPVILFDSSGKVKWKYSDKVGVDDSSAGDVDGDGKLEIGVGFNGDGGVHLLDASGKKLWRQEGGNVWHVEMVDTDGDGKAELVHSGGQSRGLTILDAKGNVKNPTPISVGFPSFDFVYISHFSRTRWKGSASANHFVAASHNEFVVMSGNAKRVARLKAPGIGRYGDAYGTPIRFGPDEYYAVLASYENWDRAVFLLFDSEAKIAYREILPDPCASILAMPSPKGERLLVGCDQVIWEYAPSRSN